MAVAPSPKFAVLLLFMHITSALVLVLTTIPLSTSLVLLVLIVCSLIYHLARDALLLLPNSWCEVTPVPEGLSVVTRDGAGLFGRVENKTLVSPYFVLLRVRLEGRRLPVARVIFPDALEPDAFRALCVQLKFS